jgi:hypothetical protein
MADSAVAVRQRDWHGDGPKQAVLSARAVGLVLTLTEDPPRRSYTNDLDPTERDSISDTMVHGRQAGGAISR